MHIEKHEVSNYYWSRDSWWTKEPKFRTPTNFDEIIEIHNRLVDTFAQNNSNLDLDKLNARNYFSAYAYQLWENFYDHGFIVDGEGWYFFRDGMVVDVKNRPLDVKMIVAKYD